jgi:citronellol/citronellal dehydrogenase
MTTLKGKTLFVSGASRGIGLAIALRAARDGANVAIAAKTAEPHPKLKGTIYTAADEIRRRRRQSVAGAARYPRRGAGNRRDRAGRRRIGGIDICVNNASAISLTTRKRPTCGSTLMRVSTHAALHGVEILHPASQEGGQPAHPMLSPPLDMKQKWFEHSTAYTMAKFA